MVLNATQRRYYVPLVTSQTDPAPVGRHYRKGVCLLGGEKNIGDVETLNCDWFYDYRVTKSFLSDPRYVPMCWDGYLDAQYLPKDYSGYLLAINEGEFKDQSNMSPQEAAARIKKLAVRFENAKLIVGGASYHGSKWMYDFVNALKPYVPYGWHFHGYCEWTISPEMVLAWVQAASSFGKVGEFWLTEFAYVSGGLQEELLFELVNRSSIITRFSYFANRLGGKESYVPTHWNNPTLFDAKGLTKSGCLYRDLKPKRS